MLAIRMQRTGRKGHAQFRVVVQDSRTTPTSGRIVALLGSYNPHTKKAALDTEKASFYLNNGAQPSERVVSLLRSEGVTLPSWVVEATERKRTTRNPEKLRRNQPKEEAAPAEAPEAEAPEDAEASIADNEAPVEEAAPAVETEDKPSVEAESAE